ncbi:hypothetical protein OAP18_01720 [Gammaproteobacteria bacterium]|nr:hypothetical protein [Gammaproteobacteria bacterium]
MTEQEILLLLEAAKNANDTDAYYAVLSDAGVGYGNLARDAALDQGFFGRFANNFLENKASEVGVPYSDQTRDAIMNEIMAADFEKRESKGLYEVDTDDIRDYHHETFENYGLPPEAWTGTIFDERAGPRAWCFTCNPFEFPDYDPSDPNKVSDTIFENILENLQSDLNGTLSDTVDFLQDTIFGDPVNWQPAPGSGVPIPLPTGVLYDTLVEYFQEYSSDVLESLGNRLYSGLENLSEVIDEYANLEGFVNIIKNYYDQLSFIPRPSSPLVLDLDGDGYELSSVANSTTFFDLDVNDFAELTGWVSGDDGFLALDRNGNGVIDNGLELFGDHTAINGGTTIAADGFAALADLDLNADGLIDVNDTQFHDLRVWQDINQNGISEESELSTLVDLGIASISLSTTVSSATIEGNTIPLVSTFTWDDGSTGNIGDVYFATEPVQSAYVGEVDLVLDALLQPLARGYGNVADLHIAMSQDPELLSLVQDFTSIDISSVGSLDEYAEEIIYRWSGVDGVDPNSRGNIFDARKLEAIEMFMAQEFISADAEINPSAQHLSLLNETWNALKSSVVARLAAQSFLLELFPDITYSFETDSISTSLPISEIVQSILVNQPIADSSAYLTNMFNVIKAMSSTLLIAEEDLRTEFQDIFSGTQYEALFSVFQDHLGGTNGDDIILSENTAVVITAGEGNDTISVSGGESTVYAGSGNDEILFHYLSDDGRYEGGDGDDVIHLSAGDGAHASYVKDRVFVGGKGDDYIESGASRDVYLFNRGDGSDVIHDLGGYGSYQGSDKIIFGSGIVESDLLISVDGDDIVITIEDPADPGALDRITLESAYTNPFSEIEVFEFADGSSLSGSEVKALAATQYGTSGDDVLVGTSENETFYGYEGNDTIDGNSGENYIEGGLGDDMLTGGDDADVIYGGDGNDVVNAGHGSDVVDGGAGDDVLTVGGGSNIVVLGGSGNDEILFHYLSDDGRYEGGDGDDVIHLSAGDGAHASYVKDRVFVGGKGDDYIESGASRDVYLFNRGDGSDVIHDLGGYGSYQGSDKIIFGSGIVESDLLISVDGDDIVITIEDPADPGALDRITLESAYTNPFSEIEVFEFADGSSLSGSEVKALAATQYGTSGDDVLVGTSENETFYGYEGNDTIDGNSGENYIEGGLGDDMLTGGDDADVIYGGDGNDVVNAGHGSDVVDGGAGDDVLTVGGGRCTAELSFGPDGGEGLRRRYDDIDDYHGLQEGDGFGTPIEDAEGNTKSGYENFRVEVRVRYAGDDAVLSLAETHAKLITVSISHRAQVTGWDFSVYKGNY